MKQHRNETGPNTALPGYYHVSASGPYRSTLKYSDPKLHAGLSARQRRKLVKTARRWLGEVQRGLQR